MRGAREHESVDVLIVGSGPAGSTYARTIAESRPDATILMVEVGPKLSDAVGEHTNNMHEAERVECQLASQGPDAGNPRPPLDLAQAVGQNAFAIGAPFIFPGLFPVGDRARVDGEDGLPAACMSSGVGGMGVYWGGSCPRPNASERVPFIPDDEFAALYVRAEQLLRVDKDPHEGDEMLAAMREALAVEFDADGPDATPVGFMPVAASRVGDRLRTSGTEAILGSLARGAPTFELRADTLVRRILLDDRGAVGAELQDRVSGATYELRARRVVVCADSLRTPQLLFASGLRPRALGHHLNDHFQMSAIVKLHDEYVREMPAPGERAVTGSVLIPFSPARPMQGQVVPLSRTGSFIEVGADTGPVPLGQIGILAWYAAKDIQFRDAVEFSETERDFYGMPAMTIRYTITDVDRETIAQQRANLERSAKVVGELLTEPARAAGGSSLHYQGTVRMGTADDGESVCDPHARVWGVEHLALGGNGLIPTATAANPTLTNVALAVRAGERLAAEL